jgi:hypothetical protein
VLTSQAMRILALLYLSLFFLGCATTPKATDEASRGSKKAAQFIQWEAKAQIKDLKRNSSNNVSIDIIASGKKAVRFEVSTSLGLSVASMLLKGQDISYVVKPWKKYYFGSANEDSLVPILKMNVDPRWFYNFLYEEPLQADGWNCVFDQGGLLETCINSDLNYTITWSDREGKKKRVKVSSEKFEINLLVKDFKTLVEAPEGAFVLQGPDDYRKIKLN